MSAPVFRRVLAQSMRNCAHRTPTSVHLCSRRGMASSAGPEKSSDTPWLIGSGLVTVLGVTLILSPRSKKPAHNAAKAAKSPIEHALPKKEEEEPIPQLMKDDEGKEEDIGESQKMSFATGSPKDAQATEESESRFEEGAPGQTDDVNKPEQKENPAETKHSGTLQDKPDGPTDLGDSRSQAKEQKAPKEAAKGSES